MRVAGCEPGRKLAAALTSGHFCQLPTSPSFRWCSDRRLVLAQLRRPSSPAVLWSSDHCELCFAVVLVYLIGQQRVLSCRFSMRCGTVSTEFQFVTLCRRNFICSMVLSLKEHRHSYQGGLNVFGKNMFWPASTFYCTIVERRTQTPNLSTSAQYVHL